MDQTRLLFLDMDGVINSLEYNVGSDNIERDRRFRLDDFDPVKVGLIRFICKQTDAKIVISSTWRIGRELDWFKGFFEAIGWPMPPIIGVTPQCSRMTGGIGRGDEVNDWLHATYPDFNDRTDIKYAILDDDSDFYNWQPFVKTHFLTGITLKEVIEVIDILGPGAKYEENRINGIKSYLNFGKEVDF